MEGWVVNATSQSLYPRERDPVPIVQEARWVSQPVWTGAENLTSHWDTIPGPSSPQRVAIPTEVSRLQLRSKFGKIQVRVNILHVCTVHQ